MASIWDWLQIGDVLNNDDVDSAINFIEHQPPSTLNNSARAVMARMAFYVKAQGGALTSAGSGSAYTITTGETHTDYVNGEHYTFVANHTSATSCTVQKDGIATPKKLYLPDGTTQAGAGHIVSGYAYRIRYNSAADAGTGGFIIQGSYGTPWQGNAQPLDADLTAIAALTTAAAGRSVLTLADPNADRIVFWDDSADSAAWLALGSHLSISGTTLSVTTGTSGGVIPLLDGANTWSGAQLHSAAVDMANNVAFNVSESGGTARSGLKMNSSNVMELGHASIALSVLASAVTFAANPTISNNTPSLTLFDANAANVGAVTSTFLRIQDSASNDAARFIQSGGDFFLDNIAGGDLIVRLGVGAATAMRLYAAGGLQAPVSVSSETTGALSSTSRNQQVHCSGNITLPASGMTDGDCISIDPRGTARTITRPGSHTMYVNGADVATATTNAHNICTAKYHGSSKWTVQGAVA